MLQSFVDTTAVHKQRTGTSTWILQLLGGLSRSGRIDRIIACGGDRVYVSAACVTAGDRFMHLPARSPHVALNFEWAGNQTSVSSGICFFPNYFMPFGWTAPSAVTIHDVSFLSHPRLYSFKMRNWYRNRIKHTVSRADVIVTVSRSSCNAIIEHLGVHPDRIFILPPIDASCIKDHIHSAPGSPHNKPYFLYTGTIEPRKNILNLIEGYKKSGITDTDLVLIGRPNASAFYFRKFLRIASLTPGVRYLGYQNDPVVDQYVTHCQGLIQLSWLEGFGIPLFQALLRGIPTLVSDDPALSEMAGEHALVAKPGDTAMIASQIARLHERAGHRNPDTAAWLREKGSRQAWDLQLDQIIDRLSEPSTPSIPLLKQRDPDPERAIVEGICYAAVFNAPIHPDKLYAGLRCTKITPERFHTTLKELLDTHPDLFRSEGALTGLSTVQFGASNPSPELRNRHRRVLKVIASFPWIRSIYYSGGTVHGTGLDMRPDLDLFIVTRAHRVWLTYALIRLISILSGNRHSVCCNYLVDESAMGIIWQKEYYTAFQLLHLRQAVRKKHAPHMRAVNPWIYEFFPNAPRFSISQHYRTGAPLAKKGLLYGLNLMVMVFYEYFWIKKGRVNGTGGIRFDAGRIKLHTNDHRPAVYSRFQNIFNRTIKTVQTYKTGQTVTLMNKYPIPEHKQATSVE